jgi:pimeloyl-ACP methyl ester carboxylesterase
VLHLPFAVHHAGTEPTPTALTFLNGGPGLSAMRIAPLVTGQLSGLPEDIVFLERRGLGLAKPAFTCPPGVRLGAGRWNLKGALACRDHWRALGFDLDAYDSAAAAADLEALRRLLGYRQWDLYGISYGTAYAISAMRDFPRSVRSALLDSVYPYQLDPFRDNVAKHFAKFDKIFTDCAADIACSAAFPDLHSQLINAIARASTTPLATPRGPLDGARLLARLAHDLEETDLLPRIPALVAAAARGDGDTLDRLDDARDPSLRPAAGFPARARADAVWPMVECRERFSRHHGATQPVTGWPEWLVSSLDVEWGPGEAALCRAWKARPAPAGIDRRLAGRIPTLILVGADDPQTTPVWAAHAVAMMPPGAAQVAVVPNVSHVTTVSACGRALAMAFLADPGAPIDRGCLTGAPKLAFVTP